MPSKANCLLSSPALIFILPVLVSIIVLLELERFINWLVAPFRRK